MTEAEWLACKDPGQMVAYLEAGASERALLLLCCACCRRLWHLLETPALRQAVDAAERFADGEIDNEAFRVAALATHPLMNYREEIFSGHARDEVVRAAYALNAAMLAVPGHAYVKFSALAAGLSRDRERAVHVDLIRDVFGNPFHPAVVQPEWRRRDDGLLVRLATSVYEERSLPAGTLDLDRLAVLADALEDSGCADPEILGHLRVPGPHVRGCFVVDLILGST
jgi:hypothetical protein